MARIQICDLNPSESELYELTEEELLDVQGGRWPRWLSYVLMGVGAALALTGVGGTLGVALVTIGSAGVNDCECPPP